MCSQSDLILIEDIISEFMDNGNMFTAFDVTIESKKRGCEERHRNIKRYIHESCFDLIASGENYERTLMKLKNGCQAYVYHIVGEDLEEYVDKGVKSIDNKKKSAVAVPDYRGRLCVPSGIVREVGFDIGEMSEIVCKDGLVVVRKDQGLDDGVLNKVDSYGNIRVSQSILKRANIGGAKGYTVSVSDDGNSIEINL